MAIGADPIRRLPLPGRTGDRFDGLYRPERSQTTWHWRQVEGPVTWYDCRDRGRRCDQRWP